MPLDPVVKALLDRLEAAGRPPTSTLEPGEARENYRRLIQLAGIPEKVAASQDRSIPGPAGKIPVRIYSPLGAEDGPLPVLVFYQGGGMVIGDLDTHDQICRMLANRAGCKVVSVAYRLAPEYKFPAAVEDSYSVLQWVAGHTAEFNGDSSRLAVGGDSAGGNLSAVVAQLARDQGGPRLLFQLLIYPATAQLGQFPSYEENAQGYFLSKDSIVYFYNHTVGKDADPSDPRIAPLEAENLAGLPSALVITAEYDPLRDEGKAYADRLREAGVPVSFHNYEGMIHAFYQMPGLLPLAIQAIDESAQALKAAFSNKLTSHTALAFQNEGLVKPKVNSPDNPVVFR